MKGERRRFLGLIFDNGDILFDASLWRCWLACHLQQNGVAIDYAGLVPIWERHLVPVYEGRKDYWLAFADMMMEFGFAESDIQIMIGKAKKAVSRLQSKRVPMPGVPNTLSQLRESGIKLAVLSDSESGESGVRKILQQLGIEQYFDTVISSRDIGTSKPNPEAFAAAVTALDLPIDACGFVGHDVDELTGAIDFGLYAIAYNYELDAPASVYLDSFDELILLVDSAVH